MCGVCAMQATPSTGRSLRKPHRELTGTQSSVTHMTQIFAFSCVQVRKPRLRKILWLPKLIQLGRGKNLVANPNI